MNWLIGFKILAIGSLAGSTTSSIFIFANKLLTTDSKLDLWEFGITLSVPIFVSIIFSIISKMKLIILLPITYMTLLIPTLGAVFGSAGSEPFWQFSILGFIGGLSWSTPFVLWSGLRTR